MKAPEKIFVSTDQFGFLHAYDSENHPPIVEEYVHKDSFMEKVEKWIDDTFHEASIDGFGGESVDVVMSDICIHKDDLLESFRNLINGKNE